jgi:hypothetical protein
VDEQAMAAGGVRKHGYASVLVLVLLIVSLPLAVWTDLRNITELALRRQAGDMNAMLTSIRGFYTSNVVERVLAPIAMKGIAREVVPYAITGSQGENGEQIQVFSELATGLDLYLDLGRIDAQKTDEIRALLQKAMDALDRNNQGSSP